MSKIYPTNKKERPTTEVDSVIGLFLISKNERKNGNDEPSGKIREIPNEGWKKP